MEKGSDIMLAVEWRNDLREEVKSGEEEEIGLIH